MATRKEQTANAQTNSKQDYVDIKMGNHDLFVKKGYDMMYTINDFLLGMWFLIGSIFFYFESLKDWGVTLFVLGSVQMLIRPTIRLFHRFQLRKHYENEYDRKQ
ncbi:YrhK family protein [Halobacillus amylolyticus]|uniref:YrhK family protein n=1 Tax=Halobacillus amylolyticus TaxID=2932259 RepID=A0ABY4H825_9BACI|nr:YrhK family protein [Halobacillus amylolyticus]UOR10859.1 YrhK family protein [Halobacillus amylolyticus]